MNSFEEKVMDKFSSIEQSLARLETRTALHAPCSMVRSLNKKFWAALVTLLLILLPLALKALALGLH